MKRTKVALDANIPQRLVRMLQSGFGDQGFEFIWEPEFAAANASDEIWTASFRRFGGHVVLSGDRNLAKRPHQILAFMDNDLIGFFFDKHWCGQDITFKTGHIMLWWSTLR